CGATQNPCFFSNTLICFCNNFTATLRERAKHGVVMTSSLQVSGTHSSLNAGHAIRGRTSRYVHLIQFVIETEDQDNVFLLTCTTKLKPNVISASLHSIQGRLSFLQD